MGLKDEGEYLAYWMNLYFLVYMLGSLFLLRRLIVVHFCDLYLFILDCFILMASKFLEVSIVYSFCFPLIFVLYYCLCYSLLVLPLYSLFVALETGCLTYW